VTGSAEAVHTVLADGLSPVGVYVRTHGSTRVAVHSVELPAGAALDWHYHPGRVVAVVVTGTLKRILADGSVQITGPGEALVEPEGPLRVHRARNDGPGPLLLYAVYLVPTNSPLSCPAADPDPLPDASVWNRDRG